MKTKISTSFMIFILSLSMGSYAQNRVDKDEIKRVIRNFASGVDKQKGEMITSVFREGAGFYATNNRDKILSVTPMQLAELHEAKKFGGRDRKLSIESLDVTDDIVASAKVIAQDDVVFYAYYISLAKIDGNWLIQTVLQHSKMKS